MTAIGSPTRTPLRGARAEWRAVAMPTEHGGWGLTLEPALLGLLIAPSTAGAAIGAAALVAFLVRTPLKVVLVDRWRGRWLPRSRRALAVTVVEAAVLAALALAAIAEAGGRWLWPVAVALPLVALELAYDMRSRSRRLVPELAGAIGIAATAAAVALAGGERAGLAIGVWLIVAARAVASIPFVRVQIDRLRHGYVRPAGSDGAQAAGVLLATSSLLLDRTLLIGALAVATVAVLHLVAVRRPPVRPTVLGVRQMLIGLAVVFATAGGVTWM